MRSWAWLTLGVAHHGVANTWGAVPVSTLACLAGLLLASLRADCSLSGRFFCSSLVRTRLCQPPYGRIVRLCRLLGLFWGLRWPACLMWSLCCHRGVPDAWCWFAAVVSASGPLVRGCVVVRMGPAGCVWSL